ncbi:hypothetical protein MY11210_001760 [Beauveria gryllotalpidicola]
MSRKPSFRISMAVPNLATKDRSLEYAGAGFLIVVSNTWHRATSILMQDVEDVAIPAAAAITVQGLEKEAARGVKVAVPTEAEQTLIDGAISKELSYWHFETESKKRHLENIDRLVEDEGCRGCDPGVYRDSAAVQAGG